MPYRERPMRPLLLPIHPEAQLTADPGLTVESRRFTDVLTLQESLLWQTAPLTRDGRAEVVGAFREGWLVRRPSVNPPFEIVLRQDGGPEPCAIVLMLRSHTMYGRLVSAVPEHIPLEHGDRSVIVTADRVIAVRGANEARAFGYLANLLVGTHWSPRRRARPIPAEDADALRLL